MLGKLSCEKNREDLARTNLWGGRKLKSKVRRVRLRACGFGRPRERDRFSIAIADAIANWCAWTSGRLQCQRPAHRPPARLHRDFAALSAALLFAQAKKGREREQIDPCSILVEESMAVQA
jgi:hypothetical protein